MLTFQKRQRVKERSVEQKENRGAALVAAGTSQAARRPQRAAATNAKSYREPDSASQSETEEPPAPKVLLSSLTHMPFPHD